MHRQSLIKLLNDYSPVDTKEIKFKQQMLDFIKEYPNCFERELELGHITASAWILNKDHSKALLLHHMKLDQWFQLGGHCDGDSDVLAVSIKEAQEESGIDGIEAVSSKIFDIDIHLIPANKYGPAHDHYDVRFLLHVVSDEELVQNHESKELRWIGKNRSELPTDSESVTRMFDKWLEL